MVTNFDGGIFHMTINRKNGIVSLWDRQVVPTNENEEYFRFPITEEQERFLKSKIYSVASLSHAEWVRILQALSDQVQVVDSDIAEEIDAVRKSIIDQTGVRI